MATHATRLLGLSRREIVDTGLSVSMAFSVELQLVVHWPILFPVPAVGQGMMSDFWI